MKVASQPWPLLSTIIKGTSTLLIKDGEVDQRAMRKSHMSMDDLLEDLREKGVSCPEEVEEALEGSGKLSVIKKRLQVRSLL